MDKKGDFIPILYGEWKTDVKLLTNTKQYIKIVYLTFKSHMLLYK